MISLQKLTTALFAAGSVNAVYYVFAEQDPIDFLRQRGNVVFFIVPMLLLVAYLTTFLAKRDRSNWRTALIALTAVFILTAGLGRHITLRLSFDKFGYVHDGLVQTEEAARFFRQGVNPYSADYRATSFGRAGDYFSLGQRSNPAWDHYVYLPGAFLLIAPFQTLSEHVGGLFDGRFVYGWLWLGALVLLVWLAPRRYRDLARI